MHPLGGRIQTHAVVAMYESQMGATVAFNALRRAGLDMHRLTLVGHTTSATEPRLGFPWIGIPTRNVANYEDDVRSGRFLVMLGGTAEVVGRACALLGQTRPSRLNAHAT
jgi:hypothetical protein